MGGSRDGNRAHKYCVMSQSSSSIWTADKNGEKPDRIAMRVIHMEMGARYERSI